MAALRPREPEPPETTAEFKAEVDAARQRLADAATRAGLEGDPYGVVLAAQASMLGTFPKLVDELKAIRQPISPAVITQLTQAAGAGAGRYVMDLAKAANRKTVALLVLGGLALFVIGGGAGAWLGWREGLRTATPYDRMSVDDAAAWAKLIAANRTAIIDAMHTCEATAKDFTTGGKGCLLPVWLDRPPAPPVTR
jgi:hypothetical protein